MATTDSSPAFHVGCSETVSSCFLQNILHSLNQIKATQGSGMHVVTAGLRSTFDCISAAASSHNILSVFCYLLKTPAPPANWLLLFVFWRSQLFFINDEPWCWYKPGGAGGFLFLSAALSVMQHAGRGSLGEAEETGAHRQDPSCALCCRSHWLGAFTDQFCSSRVWEGLQECKHQQKNTFSKQLMSGWTTLLIAQRVIGVLGSDISPWALFSLHTSHSLWLLLPLLTISPDNFPVFFQALKKHLLVFLPAWHLLTSHSPAPQWSWLGMYFPVAQQYSVLPALLTPEQILRSVCALAAPRSIQIPTQTSCSCTCAADHTFAAVLSLWVRVCTVAMI